MDSILDRKKSGRERERGVGSREAHEPGLKLGTPKAQ